MDNYNYHLGDRLRHRPLHRRPPHQDGGVRTACLRARGHFQVHRLRETVQAEADGGRHGVPGGAVPLPPPEGHRRRRRQVQVIIHNYG